MTEARGRGAVSVSEHTQAGDFAHGPGSAEDVARTERTDALNSGLVHTANYSADDAKRGRATACEALVRAGDLRAQSESDGDFGDDAGSQMADEAKADIQRAHHRLARRKEAAKPSAGVEASQATGRSRDAAGATGPKAAGRGRGGSRVRGGKATGRKAKAEAANRARQSRRAWATARKTQEAAAAGKAAAASAAKAGGAKAAVAAAASSAGVPVAGVLVGVLAFVFAALVVSQMASALFGFWENEEMSRTVEGLPPYISYDMVEAALECQEKYGHPAGCTLAQIICESGVGDHLSGLATQDNNLFGIKWASTFASCPEVTGKRSWQTNEEVGGRIVTIMADFTRFKSQRDCITFRSRVLLANSRYADNPLIREAIAEHDSDKMAEGLKAAGYATSSDYVDSLKSTMKKYNLYRFDGVSLDDWKSGSADGNAIVAAARTQLGVNYVWGGTTPGVGLDCSGLTQYCYKCAGISIPRTSEDQHAAGRAVPLSEARPGDILWKPGHVAIYIGDGKCIEAPHTGAVVSVSGNVSRFSCAVRF